MDQRPGRKRTYQERVEAVDMMLRQIEIRQKDIIRQQPKQQVVGQASNFNSRGQVIYSPSQIREKYEKAPFFFKWYQLPFCRRSIKSKLSFWASASVIFSWTFGQYTKKKNPAVTDIKLPFKFYLKAYAVFFAITAAYTFAESLLTDQFCNIQSPFYQQNESRLSLAKRIRGQINEKQGTFLKQIF